MHEAKSEQAGRDQRNDHLQREPWVAIDNRTREDERIAGLDEQLATAEDGDRQRLRGERDEQWTAVRSEKLGEVAAEFDRIHSIQRAVEVGSVDAIISVARLRPAIIDAIERGLGG